METLQTIAQRRSVRKYNDRPVSDEAIRKILDAAMRAPSGLNLQPWYFVVVKSEEKRRELLSVMENVSIKISDELDTRFAKHPEVAAETKQFIRHLGNAPVMLLVFLLRDDYPDEHTATLSVAAATENALLAARDLNLGTCWLTASNQTGYSDEIREKFAPGKGRLIATISLGYTDEFPQAVRLKENRYTIV